MTDFDVLIVEDDGELRALLARGLSSEGFHTRVAGDARRALELVAGAPPDVLVLDVGLPDSDGRDLCQALRAQGVGTPVLFLTARDTVVDRLSGFDAGGDDYLVKPFDFDELIARLRALLRRAGTDRAVTTGRLRLDPASHGVSCGAHQIALTPTEYRLLGTMASRPGDAIRRRELVRAGWPHGAIVHDNTLDVYLARLRRKLGALDEAPTIRTVRGIGYQLDAD